MTFLENLSFAGGTAALAPAFLLLLLAVAADRRPEPPRDVAAAVLLGVAGILLLRYVRVPFDSFAHAGSSPAGDLFLRMLFGVAIPEELVKIAGIALIAWRARAFDEPMDGIVYGAAVGLGFAAYENLGYIARHRNDLVWTAILRGLLSVPFHAALGALAGGYIARARLGRALGGRHPGWPARVGFYALAFAVPVTLHAIYDFCLLEPHRDPRGAGTLLALLPIVGLAAAATAVSLAVAMCLRIARHQKPLGSNRALAEHPLALWTEFLAGCAAVFAGIVLIAAAVRPMQASGTVGIASAIPGLLLLAGAAALLTRTRRRLRGRHA